ncbi:Scarecrow-like protein [Quillaja saponaria]|uniref:Scarecrow-like protein n=1 Tax=Quillaja saponaria TaxID=32244 RepID=A0AAD7LQ27_QUISA|nr:Scarecrow-like protein [Quillaja saponaria]KAJ7962118.1 Scarecrow-like protein [Quillaja saponaria]
MPLPFEKFQGKGVLDFSSASDLFSLLQPQPQNWNTNKEYCYVGSEPTSVLDSRRSPSPPTSSSTMYSSLGSNGPGNGGGTGSTDSTKAVAEKVSENPSQSMLDVATEKCGLGMEDWESVLSESHGQDQSILRLIMGDIEDPSVGLSKLLQSDPGWQNVEFNEGVGSVDQGFGLESITSGNLVSNIEPSVPVNCTGLPFNYNSMIGPVSSPNNILSSSASNILTASSSPGAFHPQQQLTIGIVDEKTQTLNTQLLLNHNPARYSQSPSLFMPLPYAQIQEHNRLSQPQMKHLNSGAIGPNSQVLKVPFLDLGQGLHNRQLHQQIQSVPHILQQKQKMVSSTAEDLTVHQLQQAIIDQIFKAAELIETGNPVPAQVILARLNFQLSPKGKPFERAAFYMKEALQLLLHTNTCNSMTFSPISLIFKIGAYKAFSENSPVLQFANFTCNQALLEAMESYDRIHIIDFDIGYGVQWASFMQELALRNGGSSSLKITAFLSPSTCDEVEFGFTFDNLKQYAKEINLSFELQHMRFESLNSAWPLPIHVSEGEVIAVNLPIGSFSQYPSSVPWVLHFVKHLMPKIVVCIERSCDRNDQPFPNHLVHALQSYSGLLESLDAVKGNQDILQKIERHFLQPAIEKIVMSRHRSLERIPPWRTLLLSSGFCPLTFSNLTESQAECLVQRTPVRGFHVEKKQSSLALCWQRKELISVSSWRC